MTIDMKAIHDSDRTLVMGVLNITEDSFSDGGCGSILRKRKRTAKR